MTVTAELVELSVTPFLRVRVAAVLRHATQIKKPVNLPLPPSHTAI